MATDLEKLFSIPEDVLHVVLVLIDFPGEGLVLLLKGVDGLKRVTHVLCKSKYRKFNNCRRIEARDARPL